MDRLEALQHIAAEAASGDLVFPTSARVALKIKEVLDDPECHVGTVARLIEAEPLLAARSVAIANSVAYNAAGREVADVRTAVARLGFTTLRWLASALVSKQMAGILAQPEQQSMAVQLWEHTAHVAALARVIARRVTRQDPEVAMFAGIVHEIGGFYLLCRSADYPALLDLAPADWEERGERVIGRAVLSALVVPQAILAAIEDLWQGYLALPPRTLGDTLLLADELAPVESPLRHFREPAGEKNAAMLDTAIGEKTLLGLLAESRDETDSLLAALRS